METSIDNSFRFIGLTPTNDADISGYKEALDYVFTNGDIRCVAITGSYGSGKSSVIDTYSEKCFKSFRKITLAHFTPSRNENISYEDIQRKIINSLVQQIKSNEAPDSKFKVKKTSRLLALWLTVRLMCVVILLGIMVNTDGILVVLDSFVGTYVSSKILCLVFCIISVIALGTIVYDFVRWVKNSKNISRIKIRESEFVINDEKTYFDRHLDEILYLLTEAKCDGFVFEDLDRYREARVELFESLRELCFLANNRCVRNKKKKVIRFFFLLSDDVFGTEERTKFFDYIIPIIPFVDSSNSYSIFRKYLEESDSYKEINDLFLRKVCLYISDMRTVKNIVNEYQIYRYKLRNIEKNSTQLLAFIIYKNMFPDDFARLQTDRGILWSVFSQKENLLIKKQELLNNELNENRKTMESLDVNQDEGLEQWRKLNRRNDIIEKDILHIKSNRLFELIDDSNREIVFSVISVRDKKRYMLFRFLIENGYINENTYRDNMSYFREGGLSVRDKNYLISVNSHSYSEFDYRLDNVEIVCEYLDEKDFLEQQTRNYYLIDYILSNRKEELIVAFVNQLEENSDYDFVNCYYKWTEYKDQFVYSLSRCWKTFLQQLSLEDISEMSDDEKQDIVIRTLIVSEPEIIEEQNIDDCLKDYLGLDTLNIVCNDMNESKLKETLIQLSVRFENINSQILSDQLWDDCYMNDLYELNLANIENILNKKYNLPKGIEPSRILTEIFSDEKQPLCKNVLCNMDEVVSLIMSSTDIISDSEETVIRVLNSDIDEDTRDAYISIITSKISDITTINECYWSISLVKGAIKGSYDNMYAYYCKNGLDEHLVDYINNLTNDIDFSRLSEDEELKLRFWNDSYINADYNDIAYKSIVQSIGQIIKKFDVRGLGENSVNILIEYDLIVMSLENLKFLRVNYKANMLRFIIRNIEAYQALIPPNSPATTELLMVIESNEVPVTNKQELIKKITSPISIQDRSFEDEVLIMILTHNYDKADFVHLISNYSTFTNDVKNVIYRKAKNSINDVLMNINSVDYSLIKRLFSDDAPFEFEVAVLDVLIGNRSNSDIYDLLVLMGESKIAKLFSEEKHRLGRVVNDTQHVSILNVLKKHSVIEGYEIDGDDLKIRKKK